MEDLISNIKVHLLKLVKNVKLGHLLYSCSFAMLFFTKQVQTVYYFNCPGKLDSGILELHYDSTDVPVNTEKRQCFMLTERPLTDVSLKRRKEALTL